MTERTILTLRCESLSGQTVRIREIVREKTFDQGWPGFAGHPGTLRQIGVCHNVRGGSRSTPQGGSACVRHGSFALLGRRRGAPVSIVCGRWILRCSPGEVPRMIIPFAARNARARCQLEPCSQSTRSALRFLEQPTHKCLRAHVALLGAKGGFVAEEVVRLVCS